MEAVIYLYEKGFLTAAEAVARLAALKKVSRD